MGMKAPTLSLRLADLSPKVSKQPAEEGAKADQVTGQRKMHHFTGVKDPTSILRPESRPKVRGFSRFQISGLLAYHHSRATPLMLSILCGSFGAAYVLLAAGPCPARTTGFGGFDFCS